MVCSTLGERINSMLFERTALSKNPEHLSTYNLTIEQGTAFAKLQTNGKLTMPDDEHQLELYKRTIELLTNKGFHHYEISNFARPGKESKHNITYWENTNTLGLGAGASSYINGTRFKNINLPAHYIRQVKEEKTAVEHSETLEPRQAMGETIMLGLRLLKGISIHQFERRFQVSFTNLFKKKDIEEINQKYLKGVKFIYVDSMTEVIDNAMTNRKVLNHKVI